MNLERLGKASRFCSQLLANVPSCACAKGCNTNKDRTENPEMRPMLGKETNPSLLVLPDGNEQRGNLVVKFYIVEWMQVSTGAITKS